MQKPGTLSDFAVQAACRLDGSSGVGQPPRRAAELSKVGLIQKYAIPRQNMKINGVASKGASLTLVSVRPSPRPGSIDDLLVGAGLATILIGIHTGLSITRGQSMIVPYALALAGSIVIFATAWRKLHSSAVACLLILCFGIALQSAIIITLDPTDPIEKIRSTAIFVESIWIGAAAYLAVHTLKRDVAEKIFLVIAITCILGSILELYTSLRVVSDDFRRAVNTWRSLYVTDIRDTQNYGGVRPKFFSSEPSALGFTISICLLSWYSLQQYRLSRLIAYIVLTTAAMAIVRSPTILVGFLVGAGAGIIYHINHKLLRATAIIAVVAFFSLLPAFWSQFYTNNFTASYLSTGSMFQRAASPALVAIETFTTHPILGFGLGESEGLGAATREVFASSGAYARFDYLSTFSGRALITNAAWEFWIVFGIFGGIAIGAILWRLLKAMGTREPIFLLGIGSLIWTSFGGLNTPVPWVSLFLLPAIFYGGFYTPGQKGTYRV